MPNMRTIITTVIPVCCFAVLLIWSGSDSADAQSNAASALRLADGTPIEGKIVRVDEEWIEIERDGWRMQLPWWAMDGANVADQRQALVEPEVGSSHAAFARWAHWQGLASARDSAAEKAAALGEAPDYERRLPDWYMARIKAPEPTVEVPTPSEAKPEPQPSRPERPDAPRRPKPETALVKAEVATGETKAVADAITKQVTDSGVKSQARRPAVTINVGEVTLTTVRRVTWFGNIHELVKNGSFELKVTWLDGHEESTTIKSGDHMTRRSDAEVDEKVRNDLLRQAERWLKREVLRE